MGANCCVASRHHDLARRRDRQISTHTSVRRSPLWNFQWNSRTHIEDTEGNLARISHGNNRSVEFETKSNVAMESHGLSEANDSFSSPNWQESATNPGTTVNSDGSKTASNLLLPTMDLPVGGSSWSEGKPPMKSSSTKSQRHSKYPPPTTTPSWSTFKGESSSSRSSSLPVERTFSLKPQQSPGYNSFSRQISDSHLAVWRSRNEDHSPGGSLSFFLPDLPAGDSHGGSSDAWSTRLFSELVASSQRERWSFDSESVNSYYDNITRSIIKPATPPHRPESQPCGICSKSMKERSPWSSQKMVSDNCLDRLTAESDRFDPSCPTCTSAEKPARKLLLRGKSEARGRSKISRSAVADVDLERVQVKGRWRRPHAGEDDLQLQEPRRPFLRRHSSMDSRPPAKSTSQTEPKRKTFWGRHEKE
ncbi:unnamed protein product [Spirodela intermedia]|uniref:Uncharacterized protein n=1 Tax=Spirodela intermedia TaxID=51605 RepID=A0A7I8J838_SPIIN|nr:unnamed protein product [Spirodela intermedia]CAA6665592.1 unnamed protein product [Spirodela intermedia]